MQEQIEIPDSVTLKTRTKVCVQGQPMLAMVGLDFRTATLALREKVSVDKARLAGVLRVLSEHPAVTEVMLLSTCNRTELYAVINEVQGWQALLRDLLVADHDVTADDVTSGLYWYSGEEAARHLFRVAAGLESMVIGEAEIVNQIKAASATARVEQTVGTILHRLSDKALAASKRVRTEVRYDECALSVASVAVAACRRTFPDFSDLSVLVLGAGETAELTLHYLVSKGVRRVMVANRTFERAEQLAQLTGGEALPMTDFPSRLAEADVIISCTASPEPILTSAMLAPVLAGRENRPLLVVDLAVPRDVEPEVADLPGVRLLNIDQLQGTACELTTVRQVKLATADHIVDEEAREFGKWLSSRVAIALVRELKQHIEAIRLDCVDELTSELRAYAGGEREIVDRYTRALVADALREAVSAMQQFTQADDADQQMLVARKIIEQ